jgi:hypothetical protein
MRQVFLLLEMHISLVQDKIVLYNMTSKYIKKWSEKGFLCFYLKPQFDYSFLTLGQFQ